MGFSSLKELPDIEDIAGLLDEEDAPKDADAASLQQISIELLGRSGE